MSENSTPASQHPEFNLDYRAPKNGSFDVLTKKEERIFDKKCRHFSSMSIADFEQGTPKPRIWNGNLPGRPPAQLSQDIIGTPLYRIKFNNKMRVFAWRKDNTYFVIWIDAKHVSGR